LIALLRLALLLQAAPAPATSVPIPVQLAVSVTADTVTVGQRITLIVRVRAPQGATIEFPTTVDSASAASLTGMEMIGKPALQSLPSGEYTTMSAAYRLAAWDIGPQKLGLPDVVVRYNGQTGYVSLSNRQIFVKSVLPEDSALRVPKPARPAIEIVPFNWLPWIIALGALIAALGLWRLWIWYRRRSGSPLDPYAAAQQEFDRIEAMKLVQTGEGERHTALMTDVMREYLARRMPEIEPSQTSSELLAASHRIHSATPGLGELLWRTDLVKFARIGIPVEEADKLGSAARGIVESVENYLTAEEEREREQEKAA